MKTSLSESGRVLRNGLLLIFLSILAACGGGDGDESSTTNTDTTGTTDTTTTKDPAITMSGKVYDGPIANAVVTITVDGETFTATADADGVYTLDIDSSDPTAFITITATGAEGQEFIELVSIAGTFSALSDAAGTDGVLESGESGAVVVTNLSTAKAVLVLEANNDVSPTDDAELTDLEKTIDGTALLELAVAIKLVIDEGVALPTGSATTLDMASDDAAVEAVITTAEAENPGIFDDTLNAILTDPNLITPVTSEDVPELYLVNLAGCYVCANRGYVVESFQDGTGHIFGSGSSVSADTTWSIGSEGQVVVDIDPADPLVTTATCSTTSGPVRCDVTTTSLEFRLLTDGASVDTVAIKRIRSISYPFNPELATIDNESTVTFLGMETAALEKFTAAGITGTWSVPLALPNPDPVGDEYEADLLTFNTDGTGTRPVDGATFTWLVDADGLLKITFSDGSLLDVYWMRSEGEHGLGALVVATTATGEVYTLPHLVVTGVDTAYAGTLVLADFEGEWHYTDWVGLNILTDSLAGTMMYRSYDEDGAIVSEFTNQAVYDGINYEVRSLYDIDNDQNVTNCSGVTTCHGYYSSFWQPLVKDSTGRIYLLEKDKGWDFDAAVTGNFHRGALNYKHGVNRWLDPVTGGGSAKRGGENMHRYVLGQRVRKALGGTSISPLLPH